MDDGMLPSAASSSIAKPKPPGPAPRIAGTPWHACVWDPAAGCWRDNNGDEYSAPRKAKNFAPLYCLPRPPGPAPHVGGVASAPCDWDETAGCWRDADGTKHIVKDHQARKAERKAELDRLSNVCVDIEIKCIKLHCGRVSEVAATRPPSKWGHCNAWDAEHTSGPYSSEMIWLRGGRKPMYSTPTEERLRKWWWIAGQHNPEYGWPWATGGSGGRWQDYRGDRHVKLYEETLKPLLVASDVSRATFEATLETERKVRLLAWLEACIEFEKVRYEGPLPMPELGPDEEPDEHILWPKMTHCLDKKSSTSLERRMHRGRSLWFTMNSADILRLTLRKYDISKMAWKAGAVGHFAQHCPP